jgi:hypothetical protein
MNYTICYTIDFTIKYLAAGGSNLSERNEEGILLWPAFQVGGRVCFIDQDSRHPD